MSALLPVALDLTRLAVAVVGDGPRARRRLGLLRDAGAGDLTAFAAAPDDAQLARIDVLFVADLPERAARILAGRARAHGALVNIEDVPAACDFQSAAVVRRGDLAVGVWSGGRCPMLARVLKEWLDRWLPRDFGRVLDRLADERVRLRAQGAGTGALEASANVALHRLRPPPMDVTLNA